MVQVAARMQDRNIKTDTFLKDKVGILNSQVRE
jgi:hypothetical protein